MMNDSEFSDHPGDLQQELDLDLYIRVLWRQRKTVITSILVTSLLALLYLFMATPEYFSNTLLKLNPGASIKIGWTEVSELLASGTEEVPAALEMLLSRRVVGTVVDELHLDILAGPEYFPLFGAPVSRLLDLLDDDPTDLRRSFLGVRKWAWGGERILVQKFHVPQFFEGESFTVIKGKGESYQLLDGESEVVISGMVGQIARGRHKLPDGKDDEISILVAELVGREGAEFSVTKLPHIEAVEELQEDLVVAETAPSNGVVDLSWESDSAIKTAQVVDAVARVYVEQNLQKKKDQLDLLLAFIESQLPVIRANLLQAEDEFNKYHSDSGSVDVNLEASTLLAQLVELESQISSLALLKIDYQQTYTEQHPSRVALENKFRQLQGEKDSINAKIALLPGNEIQALTVQKKVDMLSETHLLLLQRQQEFSIARAGLTGDFSIVDKAVIPLEIDSPDYIIIPILAVFLGGFVGLVLVLFRKRNIEVIDSPENLARFGLPVLATVVRPSEQGKLAITRILRNRFPHMGSGKMSAADQTINGLHDLRVCLEYSTKFVESGLVLVAAPSPDSGVSFISSRLARLFAECGKTVVVIDANLRNGRLHESMALQEEPGLADVLIDQIELSKALQSIESGVDKNPSRGSISLLSAGRPVNDPVQALMTDEFGRMIESMKQQFDIVIVSAPALLGSTDALPVVKAIEGFKTLVVRAGQHVPAEIEFAISRSAHWGCQFDGLVFCDEPMHFFQSR